MNEENPLARPESLASQRPGAWAELPDERRHARRRKSLVRVGLIPAWVALGAVVVYYGGLGGWRFGWLIGVVLMAVVTAVVGWRALASASGRGIWVAAIVIAGFVAGIKLSDWAPMSTTRIGHEIDDMRISYQLWRQISQQEKGHGWCLPQCPEVIRVYRSPNDSDVNALAVALFGLHEIGLVQDVRAAYSHQHGPDIVVGRSRHLSGTVSISHVNGRVQLTIDLTSRR